MRSAWAFFGSKSVSLDPTYPASNLRVVQEVNARGAAQLVLLPTVVSSSGLRLPKGIRTAAARTIAIWLPGPPGHQMAGGGSLMAPFFAGVFFVTLVNGL
jgi:hypothetical protein